MRSRGRLKRMMKRFGTQVAVYRKEKRSGPYNGGKYRKISSFEGIVDETLQGGDIGMAYQKVTEDTSAVLYSEPADIRKGDVITANNKYYNVKKVSNPMSADSHLEIALEETEMKIDEFSV